MRSNSLAPRLRAASLTKLTTSSDGFEPPGKTIVGPRLGDEGARGRIVRLGGAQELQRDRLGDLQRELLAQVALDHVFAAAVAAHQLGHQVGRIGDAAGAQRRLDRRQHVALHDAQQDVVARDVEALAELLLGEQGHRRTGALEAIVVDDQVGRAAADIDAGDLSVLLGRLAAQLAGDLEEAAGVAAEIARDLGVEIDELGAARLVPVGQHARRRRRRHRRASAHHHPHQVARGLGALAEDQALGQRHAGRQGDDDAAQPSRRLGMGPPAALLQALTLMNSPQQRGRRAHAETPRRLRRIVLTLPTGMPLAERLIFRKRAEAARDLVWMMMGWKLDDPAAPAPRVLTDWDEASCTQLVYLYTEVARNFGGDARRFFQIARKPRGRPAEETLSIASIDVGGGTTDLIINSYRLEGAGTSVTLFPEQKFREGFNVAGDDILLRVVQGHVLPPIEAALRAAGIANPADLMAELVGGDRGGEDVIHRNLRQQFALQIAHPLALEFLHAAETFDPTSGVVAAEPRTYDSFFPEPPSRRPRS